MFKTFMPTGNPLSLPVDPTETFEAGVVGELNATTGQIVKSTGYNPLGLLDGYKTTTYSKKVVNEAVALPAEDLIPLAHSNLTADAVRVTSDDGVTEYVEDTDYAIGDTNGTINRIATGSIGDGDTVLVSYEYNLTASQWVASAPVGNDDTLGSGLVAVHFADGLYWSDQYDITRAYAINQVLYAVDGVITNSHGLSGTPPKIGRVVRVPSGGAGSAAVPYPEMLLLELRIALP